MYDFWTLFLLFAIYSFVGWVVEVIFCSFQAKKFINRGFLNGPFCPIYGFAALFIINLSIPFKENAVLLFIMCVLVTSLLEYITGWWLEKVFHTKYWDYTGYGLDIHGRVFLPFSLCFGVMGLLLVYYVNPFVLGLIGSIPETILILVSASLMVYFLIDYVVTTKSIIRLKSMLAELQKVLDETNKKLQQAQADTAEALQVARDRLDDATKERLKTLDETKEKLETSLKPVQRRIIKAFPSMKSAKNNESLQQIKARVKSKSKNRSSRHQPKSKK